MKSFIVFALLVAAAVAAPPQHYSGNEKDAQITEYVNENIGLGDFVNKHSSSNGIEVEAEGQLQNAGTEDEAQVVRGSYSYTAPDGLVYKVSYVADQNGYRAEGAHIPH